MTDVSVEMSVAEPAHAIRMEEEEKGVPEPVRLFPEDDMVVQGGNAENVPEKAKMTRVVIASIVGNVLEWFDFGIFAFLAPTIGQLFFPKSDPVAGIVNSFVIFGGGFLIRPLGGLLLAHVGDRYGRKQALLVSVVGMAGATFGMGCLPTYEQVGPAAPIALSVLRLVQGLSVGGELVGSMIFAIESVPPHRQVIAGAYCLAGAIGGLTLGAGAGLLLHGFLEPHAIQAWGWRVPFWSGLLIALFAAWMRSGVEESSEFVLNRKQQ
eukprot:CAMPEP_0177721002 /NCGR_PEP_ID=MMETSP0484_2-20121128/16915_1 /TAXON_ID=354590 /ORGANISM="Rhodomonas lens, Strain RHODO" /LENGTH=265 /DNA_ID=CAMNT_0019233279 /DNA_START=118 /DNA_END=912 /DNA_ORIENTATION=-